MNKSDNIEVITFGCRLNTLESQVMKRAAAAAGLKNAILVNTCAVTHEAERQARQAIRRAARLDAGKKIIVSGCAAQTNAASFAAMEEVDLVLGNEEKLSAEYYRDIPGPDREKTQKERVSGIFLAKQANSHPVEGIEGRSRAFVQVQTGCDHRCTFCIIPYGRGNARSVPMDKVVEQVRRLAENGYKEAVLTGVDITSYGVDLPGQPKLGKLVRVILQCAPELERLRLSSIDSIEADADLLAALAEEPRLMPHLHLSLQSGDDMILKRMKRRHLRAHALAFCKEARRLRPDVVFGADLIAGFPTETEAMFQNSLSLVDECGLTYLHVFPFSPRKGAPAARMPQLARPMIKERAARLRKKGVQALKTYLEGQRGKISKVLMEKPGFGRTEHFTQVELAGGQSGELVSAHITGHSGRYLFAERV